MKNLIKAWRFGWSYLFFEVPNSFYSYFTAVFAEIILLWGFMPCDIALPLMTLCVLCILNVTICSYCKKYTRGTSSERVCAIAYVCMFCVILLVGLMYDWRTWLLMFFTPLVFSWSCYLIRDSQSCIWNFNLEPSSFMSFVRRMVKNKFLYATIQLLAVAGPFAFFQVFLWATSMSYLTKLMLTFLYILVIPFIAYVEDRVEGENIFAIAYNITWSKKYECNIKKVQKTPEELKSDSEIVEDFKRKLNQFKN